MPHSVDQIVDLSLTEVAEKLRIGELRAIEVTEAALARCNALNPDNNAMITICDDRAMAQAKAADDRRASRQNMGPLHGVPITIKDIFDIAGLPTTAGLPPRLDHVAEGTATVVQRLEAAGAVVLGKANVAEGVAGKYLDPFGEPHNPWNADYWGGASSGGSGVAVAAQMGYGSIGSDTGGSIRMPSTVNGVTGLKPTWGRVSRNQVFELAGTLDHVGPMGRSAEDIARLYQVIAGRDDADPTSLLDPVEGALARLNNGVKGMVIGRPTSWVSDGVDPQLIAALDDTLAKFAEMGAKIVEVSLPDNSTIVDDWYDVSCAQTAVVHESLFEQNRNSYSDSLASTIEYGQKLSATALQKAQTRRDAFRGRLKRSLLSVDAVLMPVLPFTVPTRTEMDEMDKDTIFALHRFVCPFTMSGVPALAFPVGFDRVGLPLGLQLVGPHLSEATLLRVVHAYQSVTYHHLGRPPMSAGVEIA